MNEAEMRDVWINSGDLLYSDVGSSAWLARRDGGAGYIRYVPAARLDALREAANRIEGDDVLARLRSGNATPEDQYNVANSLAYLWAQDGLLSEAQWEVDQLRDQLAEVERPLDEQMARLNANLLAANRARMDAERELEAAGADAERFTYWFGNTPKPMSLADDYMKGVRERWNLNQWRAAIDAASKERA